MKYSFVEAVSSAYDPESPRRRPVEDASLRERKATDPQHAHGVALDAEVPPIVHAD
jgi:hypothetical protein